MKKELKEGSDVPIILALDHGYQRTSLPNSIIEKV